MLQLGKISAVFLCLALVPGQAADTVLALPFFNLSNSPNLDWIGESIAETIREFLTAHDVLTLDREERQEQLSAGEQGCVHMPTLVPATAYEQAAA